MVQKDPRDGVFLTGCGLQQWVEWRVWVTSLSDQQDRIYAPIVLRIVGNLRVLSPNNLASLCHKAQLAHIHFNNCAFGDHTQGCIKWGWLILFHTKNRQAKGSFQLLCVTWAFMKRRPIDLMNLSYLGGFLVKPSPTEQTLVTILFHAFFFLFLPVQITFNSSVSP